MSLVLVVDHFEIADRRLAARAPVHDVGAAIDQPLLVKPDKRLAHGNGEPLVHREVFAIPINGGAEPLHLPQNRAAIMPSPFPNALDKLLAAHLLPGRAFGS